MRCLPTLAAALGLVVLPAAAGAQQPATSPPATPPQTPGIYYDITRMPHPLGTFGGGITSTQRMVTRCTALLWSIDKSRRDEVPRYRLDYQTGYCLGWINASMAFLNVRDEAGKNLLGVCLPEDIDSRHVAETFIAYVHKNREHLIYNPSLLIYWALLEKYPCPK